MGMSDLSSDSNELIFERYLGQFYGSRIDKIVDCRWLNARTSSRLGIPVWVEDNWIVTHRKVELAE